MPACDERSGSNELAERLSESAERALSGRIHQIRIQGDCPAGKARGRDAGQDAGGVQDSEAAHLNSPKRALESQISMSHLVPLLEFNHLTSSKLGAGLSRPICPRKGEVCILSLM